MLAYYDAFYFYALTLGINHWQVCAILVGKQQLSQRMAGFRQHMLLAARLR
jgi:hypothetical protein